MADPWVGQVLDIVQSVLLAPRNRSTEERAECVRIISEVLIYLPPDNIFGSTRGEWNRTREDFGYHLIKFLTIDLTAAFSQLHAALDSSEYAELAERHAANFDVVSKFLLYLLECDDIEKIGMEPQHILKLREDMDATFQLAIEFLRDRWDATCTPDGEAPKVLTCGAPQQDVLICSMLRTLSLWLSEDGSLCAEAVELMDVYLGLWPAGNRDALDFRPWIIGILHSILEHPGALEKFASTHGEETVCRDLLQIYRQGPQDDSEMLQGVDEARLLLSVIDQGNTLSRACRKDVVETLKASYAAYRQSSLGLGLSVTLLQVTQHCITNAGEKKDLTEVIGNLRTWTAEKADAVEDWVKTDLEHIYVDLVN